MVKKYFRQITTALKGYSRRILILVSVLLILAALVISYVEVRPKEWSGFLELGDINKANYYERAKTLWDWLDLAIIPAALALGVFLLDRLTSRREDANQKDRFREDMLQKYFDAVTKILLDNKSEVLEPEVHNIIRLRTIVLLRRLDHRRIEEVFEFLRSANWLTGEEAMLARSNLTAIEMSGIDLSFIDLSDAVLLGAKLNGAKFLGADLSGADLRLAEMVGADLNGANLQGATLEAADLRGANLTEAVLQNADLTRVRFSRSTLLPDETTWKTETDLSEFIKS